jgi:hypothetical protein
VPTARSYCAAVVQREVTLTQVLCWLLALVASFAAFSWASLMFLADHEQPAAFFASGGLALIVWLVLHLTE